MGGAGPRADELGFEDPEHKVPLYDIRRLATPFGVFDYFVARLVSVDEVGTVDHGPLRALPRNQHEGNLVSKIGDFPKILEPLKLDRPFSFMARIEGTAVRISSLRVELVFDNLRGTCLDKPGPGSPLGGVRCAAAFRVLR